MTAVRKWLAGAGLVVALLLTTFLFVMSHDAACPQEAADAKGGEPMKAVVRRCYGGTEVLRLDALERPTPADDQVLVRVIAAATNPLDWHEMTGTPYLMRLGTGFGAPREPRLGTDFAGVVVALGKGVTRFKVGDEVFGGGNGAFGEYVLARAARGIALKPAGLSFAEAAAMPVAAVTALQALRDSGQLQAGQSVLINGASGGVGTYAVQIAKAMGATVTGVCSTRNLDLVRSLGADHVIDYTAQDYTQLDEKYDVIIDNVGNHGLLAQKRVLAAKGRYVMIGGPKSNHWIGPMARAAGAGLLGLISSQGFGFMLARLEPNDLEMLAQMAEQGKIRPVIDRHYPLEDIAQAIDYQASSRARGKIIIDVTARD
ncbi:MAG: NAD(P)-dependent alcohol dehydrogenase [Steroidobacteraceae bacterium]